MSEATVSPLKQVLCASLCLFVLSEVNFPLLLPQSQLAVVAGLGLLLCLLSRPLMRTAQPIWSGWLNRFLMFLVVVTCGYIVVQTQPIFRSLWLDHQSLAAREGAERPLDYLVATVGVVLVLEATRRGLGWTLPALALIFVAYAWIGDWLPGFLLPHPGYSLERIVAQTFLHSQGVFGLALKVLFNYVLLFVVFGVVLEQTGATSYIIDLTRRIFRNSPGAPAKVAVLSSGLMGSLSGSAVANTAKTGPLTIPMMTGARFPPYVAAGIEASASSGGALVPPVMGAAAYMMLEIVAPPITYVEIIRAALLPAILYYMSLLMVVHFYSRRIGSTPDSGATSPLPRLEGAILIGSLAGLVGFLLVGYTPFRAVTLSLGIALVLSLLAQRTRPSPRALVRIATQAAMRGVPLICASACVGVIIGVVTLTGVETRLPDLILPLAQFSLFLALTLIMFASIILGMGLPPVVCYLLVATLIGPVLTDLAVVPLASHFFVFYFAMMSMVTPPVALAAYTAATIAGAPILRTGVAAFRFGLVGFVLPYMFVFRPQVLLLDPSGSPVGLLASLPSLVVASLGILAVSAAIAGYLFGRLGLLMRGGLLVAAALLLMPFDDGLYAQVGFSIIDVLGGLILGGLVVRDWAAQEKDTA